MEKIYNISDPNESIRQFYVVEGSKEKLITMACDDSVQKANYEDRKTDGFSTDRTMRKVARIYMPTVRLLAKQGDMDAAMYLHCGDAKARDRMINKHPILFKCCSGGT